VNWIRRTPGRESANPLAVAGNTPAGPEATATSAGWRASNAGSIRLDGFRSRVAHTRTREWTVPVIQYGKLMVQRLLNRLTQATGVFGI
jgi:hypothetical protein